MNLRRCSFSLSSRFKPSFLQPVSSVHSWSQLFAFVLLAYPLLYSSTRCFLSSCHDPITELAGGRLTSPPSVLLCPWSCLLSLLHLYPSPRSNSLHLHRSSSPPLPSHPSLSRALSDLPGGRHGNLHPGHGALEPLGEPVRLLEVT